MTVIFYCKKDNLFLILLYKEARKILIKNLQSHLAAGFHNLFENNEKNFLEQAVCADGLTEASVQFLRDQSLKLWHEYSLQLLKSASEKCAEDEGKLDSLLKTFYIWGLST